MMTTISMLWIILAAQAADAVAQEESAVFPERTIRIEMIEEPLDTPISTFDSVLERPRFAATIVLEEGIGTAHVGTLYSYLSSGQDEPGGERLQRDTGLSGLSEAQRKIMKTDDWSEAHTVSAKRNRRPSNVVAMRFHRFMKEGTRFFTFYGFTKEDALAVARAAIERLDAKARKNFDQSMRSLRRRREAAASGSARLAATKQKAADAQSRLDAAQEVVPYADADQAAADVADLAKSIRQAEIEIAGIRAKHEAIDGFRTRDGIDVDARTMLDRMTMQLDIELAGSLARTDSLRRHRGGAKTFRDALGDLRDAAALTQKLAPALRLSNAQIKSLIARMSSDAEKPVVLIDDKIIVQPIRYTE